MKKIIERIKKHDMIIVTIAITIILMGNAFNFILNNNDELINFLNTYKIANGLTIYKDVNVIITPLFFYIGEIFLKILGANFVTYRIYNLIIFVILYILCYEILKTLKINKIFSFFYTILIILFTYDIVTAGANYNSLSYIFLELGILLLIKMERGTKSSIIQGIILFFVFLTNQKLSAGYTMALVIYEISCKNIKSLLKELLTAGVLLCSYIIYLLLQGNLYNFINYTILGIGEFGKTNTTLDKTILYRGGTFIVMFILTIIINIIIIKIGNPNEYEKEQLKKLLIFSFCSLILIVPIINYYHMSLAIIMTFITLTYEINYLIYPIIKGEKENKYIRIIVITLVTLLTIQSTYNLTIYFNKIKDIPKDSVFYGAIIEKELQKEINDVINYINQSDKQVIVFSTYAPFYSLILNDLDNNVYDWALRGNLGKEGERGLIEKVKNLKNIQILLRKDKENAEIYQFAYNVTKYIRENMTYIGEIQNFDIYQTIK